MNQKTPPQTTNFKDLYISSYLKAKGFPLHNADLDPQGRTIFHFLETPELSEVLRKYYDGTALVSPSAYIEAFKALRSLAYSLSDSKKNMEVRNYAGTSRL